MGYANAQRMVNYVRIFAEFISQPEYANVVPMFGLINEALVGTIGLNTLMSLYVAVSHSWQTQLMRNCQLRGILPNYPFHHGCW